MVVMGGRCSSDGGGGEVTVLTNNGERWVSNLIVVVEARDEG